MEFGGFPADRSVHMQFLWLSVIGRLYRTNKAAFSNFFDVMWTGLVLYSQHQEY